MALLALCRHAKSDWTFDLSDFERPLNERGKRDVPKMAMALKNYGFQPDCIFSSPAVRAFTTAQGMASAFAFPLEKIQALPNLYDAPSGVILSVIQSIPSTCEAAIIVGHNPGMENCIRSLAGLKGVFELSTCGIALFEVDFPWKDAGTKPYSLKALLFPKMLE